VYQCCDDQRTGVAVILAALRSTDLAFCRTFLVLWETFSIWLLTGGLTR
jgi:hypothetical protein